jgi:hypothetical protein
MSVPFAEVGYFEPWWMQILKALVIFAVGLQLVPIVLIASCWDASRTATGPTALGRSACCSRWPTSSSC